MNSAPSPSPSQSKVLRRLYLTLFLRGRSARGFSMKRSAKSIIGRLWLTMLFYALAGCLALTLLGQPLFSLSIYLHSATQFFIGMFVASSAGEVLFNKEEAEILLHRPVAPRTLLWAKISVLLQVSLWLGLAFNIAGVIGGSVQGTGHPGFIPAHAVSAVISAFFCTGVVVLIYQLCLRWFGRERLDGLMTFAQVAMTLLLVAGSQMAPYVMRSLPSEIRLTAANGWLALLPPAWFAGLDETLMGNANPVMWMLAAFGVLTTAAVLVLAFGKLAGSYEDGLRTLGEARAAKPTANGRPRLMQRLVARQPLAWLLRHPVERMGFLLVAAYLSRDRDVKLRLYPGLAPFVVMPVIMLLNGSRDHGSEFMFVMASSYVALIPMFAMNLLRFSQHWQAADVFLATPTPGPGPIIIGGRKAVGLFLVLPAVATLVLSSWLIIGKAEAALLLLPGILMLPVFTRFSLGKGGDLPLSLPGEEAKSAGRGLVVMVAMFGAMAIAGVAILAKSYGYFYPYLAIQAIAVAVFVILKDRRTRSLSWTMQADIAAVHEKPRKDSPEWD